MEIEGWDYSPSNCRSTYNPVFYFTPDASFLSYLKINGSLHIPMTITDTMRYDGFFWVRIDKQSETALYCGFLPMVFDGFPPDMGKCKLSIPIYERSVLPPLTCLTTNCC